MANTDPVLAMTKRFADAYIDFVKAQLLREMPDDEETRAAANFVARHTATGIAVSLAMAVQVANNTRRAKKAGSN